MGRRQAAEWKLTTEEDVVVRLLDSNKSCLLALSLHSHVLLGRSDYFAARLSRWNSALHHPTSNSQDLSDDHLASGCNSDQITTGKCDDFQGDDYDGLLQNDDLEHVGLHAIDIVMPDPSAAAIYERCIELMYVPCNSINLFKPFSGVEDALSMLHVAAELLFHECVNACMQFLEMLPVWNPEEEASIRSTLSSLQLPHINTDLAARLSLPQAVSSQQPMGTMRSMLVLVLHLACEWLPETAPSLKSIDPAKPIPEATILLAWNANLDFIKASAWKDAGFCYNRQYSEKDVHTASSSLSWLLSNLLALQAADAVVKEFAKDTQLSSVTVALLKRCTSFYSNHTFSCPVLSLLNQIMLVVQRGDVLLSRSARCTLITTWLPVAQAMTRSHYSSVSIVVDGFLKLISSLPIFDREQIYKTFMKRDDSDSLGLSSSFRPWCGMLRQVHLKYGKGQQGLLVITEE